MDVAFVWESSRGRLVDPRGVRTNMTYDPGPRPDEPVVVDAPAADEPPATVVPAADRPADR